VADVLTWLEASFLGRAMRESGPWTYALVNVVHIFGIATLFGAVLMLDLRLMGAWRRIPLAALAAIAQPLAVSGVIAAAGSGIALLASNATEYLDNPFIIIKFGAIGVAVATAAFLNLSPAWRSRGVRDPSTREARQLAAMAATSLAGWVTAIVAGRMIGYW
jgi:hypothetical protein